MTQSALLSADQPTVEVRVADVCTDPEDALLLAALVRGLVETAAGSGAPAGPGRVELLRAARWRASRFGLSEALVHPVEGTLRPAREVAAEGIRVNAVRPGLVRTDIHAATGEPLRLDRLRPTIPMQREGEPDEIAEAVLWLLSPAASYVSGAILDVSGAR